MWTRSIALSVSRVQRMLALPFDLCPMSHRHEHIAHAWFAAFNAHDLEALLTLYAEDAEHFSPKTTGPQAGDRRSGEGERGTAGVVA